MSASRYAPWICALCLSCEAVIGVRPLPGLEDSGAEADVHDASTIDVVVVVDAGVDAPIVDAGCDAADADLATSADHCGRCGHSCLGGACEAGVCQPVTIASNQQRPAGVATDGTNVFWSNDTLGFIAGNVATCPLAGCGAIPSNLVIEGASAVAVDGTDVFFSSEPPDNSNDLSLAKCSKTGCGGESSTIVGARHNAFRFAMDATDLYVLDATSIVRCAKTGCGQTPATVVTTSASGLALDGNDIFLASNMVIAKCGKSGCSVPTPLASNETSADNIAVFGGELFWSNDEEGTGTVRRCTASACSPSTVASSLERPFSIAVDASGNYWVDYGTFAASYKDGAVKTCPLAGCSGAPIVLATSRNPVAIALDGVSVVWAETNVDYGTGRIRRVAKP
jgi:hypothetical protein